MIHAFADIGFRETGMAQGGQIKILGICGSLRHASFNKAALREAIKLAPQGVTIEEADISQISPYNEDVFAKGFPAPVEALRRQIATADALLFVTPEYNYSMPGVLKNAIDWASRPPSQPFAGKPVAMMGASMGMFGTGRAQYHLRQTCVFLDMHPINKPEVMIPAAQTKFDANGQLTDEPTRGFIAALLVALRDWALRLKG
ncbi:chromate reductase [Rhizobiales bacterium GAS191]|jgi:chromate reductase|nr:chromate reductase [Rhizobiales bacterium GAS113]SEC14830.1 chromate reductase [Rhizobiales bacterium GAS191]SED06068.1 chromate reductase [Rhizobiales bacterium GAS188]